MKMHGPSTRTVRSLLRMLRKQFPVTRPVTVRRVVHKTCEGVTHFDGARFLVYINRTQSHGSQIDSILHEYAHVVAIDEACQHKGRWGPIHGEIYQAWEVWDNEP